MMYFVNVYEDAGKISYGMAWRYKGDCQRFGNLLGRRVLYRLIVRVKTR